jgi:CheY-like chemotaxis protein
MLKEAPRPDANAADTRIRVLVVDDEAMSRRTLCQLLQMSGYFCAVAADGVQALQVVHSFQPQAIIMDLMMPVLDGFETTRRLKEDLETRDIPIIAVTASSSKQDQAHARQAGVNEFLHKPINLDHLLLHLRQHLRDPPGTPEAPSD